MTTAASGGQRPSVVAPRQQPSSEQPSGGLFDKQGNPVDPDTGEVHEQAPPPKAPPVAENAAAPANTAAPSAGQQRPVAQQQTAHTTPQQQQPVAQPKPPTQQTAAASQLVQKQGNALMLVNKSASSLNAFLTQYSEQIKGALPKHMTAERIIRITSTAVSRNPKLLDCDMGTLVAAVIQCGQLGLEPDTLGQAYLVPFKNNKNNGRLEVQCIPGYKGLRTLAYRSGAVKSIHADIVYEADEFSYSFGDDHHLKHKPYTGDQDPGKKIAWYAYAHMVGGGFVFVVLRHKDIAKAKAASKAQAFIWASDPDAMEKKTAVRRLCDELPLSVDNVLAQATILDMAASKGSSSARYDENGVWQGARGAEEIMSDAAEEFEDAEVVS